jgi:hypothetical protein
MKRITLVTDDNQVITFYPVFDEIEWTTPYGRVKEFTFRLNDGNVKRRTVNRLDSMIRASANKRLTYERLTQ